MFCRKNAFLCAAAVLLLGCGVLAGDKIVIDVDKAKKDAEKTGEEAKKAGLRIADEAKDAGLRIADEAEDFAEDVADSFSKAFE